jgi:hypothetical protein
MLGNCFVFAVLEGSWMVEYGQTVIGALACRELAFLEASVAELGPSESLGSKPGKLGVVMAADEDMVHVSVLIDVMVVIEIRRSRRARVYRFSLDHDA